MDHRKDGRIATDSQRQGEYGGRGENRILAQCAQRIADVPPECFDKRRSVHKVDLLANQGRVPELSMRSQASCFGGHTSRDVVLEFRPEMKLELVRQLSASTGAAKKPEPIHDVYDALRTLPMPVTRRSHRVVSATSRFRPRAVRR